MSHTVPSWSSSRRVTNGGGSTGETRSSHSRPTTPARGKVHGAQNGHNGCREDLSGVVADAETSTHTRNGDGVPSLAALPRLSEQVSDLHRDNAKRPLPSIVYHDGDYTTYCKCPMCTLSYHITALFANQRRSSAHVLAARPSFCCPDGASSLPPLPDVYRPENVVVCPVHASFGFCPYGVGCYLPHEDAYKARTQPLGCVDAEVDRMAQLAEARRDAVEWDCDVCGFEGISEFNVGPVGEYYYRQCPRCTFMCYFPYVTYLVQGILSVVGDDYQLFKTEVDRNRRRLPDEFKVPLTFEAHRVASVVFAWSLVSPQDARDALESANRALPELEAIISVGSGSGYVEHVFNRVANDVKLNPAWEVDHTHFPTSSFDNVRADFFGRKRIAFFSCDELALRRTYSVHVSLGGPLTLFSLDCKKSALLLCWPPFGSMQEEQSSMGFEALEYYRQCGGEVVIYIGDVASSGDWRLHQLLYTHFKRVRDYPVRRELRRWCPQEMGMVYAGNDTIAVYRLRDTPIPLPVNWTCSM